MPIIFGTTASGGDNFFTPQPPTIGTATNVGTSRAYNNGAATVTFTPSTSGGKATSFTATSTPGSLTGSASASPITVAGLQSATSYTFAVTAADAQGTSSASSASSAVTATTVPQAPTIGTATDGGTGTTVTVAYTAGATGGAAVSTYTATSSPGGFTGTGASPITVSGLTAGTAYTFTVTATNANGTSAASSASNSVTPVVPSNFFLISQQVLGSSASTVTFSSIPNTYKSLQIRSIARNTTADVYVTQMGLNLNSDSGTNYSLHYLYGDGSAVTAGGSGTSFGYAYISGPQIDNSALANTYGASIIDIVDYTLSKNKTIKYISGVNVNNTTPASNQITLGSTVWLNTSAVTTVSITAAQNSFAAGSTFSLYGVS